MKSIAFLILSTATALLSSLSSLNAQTATPASLQQLLWESRWKKRVLLIAAPTTQHVDFQQQKALLAPQAAALAERDFLVLEVLYAQLTAADQQFLAQQIGIKPPAFAAVLIGKDGGVKEKSSRPITPEALFGIVDKMPMRREEMKRRK
ncbi:DUF4174 domain-containing protein [Hymenobacter properus]|uniref:DUF4174 domain-containing protein n=1 Tax=Hymenobacter properus TaxID=2791026 RepID=A0A931BC47_9BACT|nr:DUF4174 domain-containing protein [Hymenobacter properus]MBF9141140.1 DUF4174 domain-containing protein [Hymenobacter properus]MBR7719949.1 DUF4174 domain-containing protein [Microvirga sp. SRT04]